jgi:thiol-disulfide isomerase/thioredoxin
LAPILKALFFREVSMRRLALVALLLIVALPVRAAEVVRHWDEALFDEAQAAGRTILVDVHADWCPTCRKQKPILEKLAADPAFKDALMIVVDFDTDADALHRFKVSSQSTLIVFKGTREAGRSVGDTREESIRALWAKGL